MKAKLVKFEDDGTQCKRDIEYLRRHPECGISFIQDKPFKPDNPKHKFRPIDRKFSIDTLNRPLPKEPIIPSAPPIGQAGRRAKAVGDPVSEFLPQDYTNKYTLTGRRILEDSPHGLNTDEYLASKIYKSLPSKYERVSTREPIEIEMDDLRTNRPVGNLELEDFGAGVGITNERPPPIIQSRIRPLADPRDTEFATPRGSTKEEESIRKSKGKAKVKPTEQEMFPIDPDSEELVFLNEVAKRLSSGEIDLTIQQKQNLTRELLSRGFSRERIQELLDNYEAYDPALEEATRGRPRTEEERLIRSLRSGIRSIPTRDTNLLPSRQEEIDIREDTPLTRGRTDIARGRSRIEKAYDKVAGKLPEELRTLSGSVKRNAQDFNENIRTRSLEAIQSIRTTSTRVFGQKYTGIMTGEQLETEMGTITAPEGNINIRTPITEEVTGIRSGDLQAGLDFEPTGQAYAEGFYRTPPELSYRQRIIKGAFSREGAVGGVGALGGVAAGIGVSALMQKAGVNNPVAVTAASGGAGGVVSRVITMAGSSLIQSGETAAIDAATYASIRAGTSVLRGGVEGAGIGLLLLPFDMMLNQAFVNLTNSHEASNIMSGTAIGGTATALTTIGLASLGAAPETLGMSLIIGGLAAVGTTVYGGISGAQEDQAIKEANEQAHNLRAVGIARKKLLATLPQHNYDINKAFTAYPDKESLGVNDETWQQFFDTTGKIFRQRPSNTHVPTPQHGGQQDPDAKRVNDLFSKYIKHSMINIACAEGDCTDLQKQDPGSLTFEEKQFLNDKTNSTWRTQGDMQVEMSMQEMNYTRQRIADAKQTMLDEWNNNQKIANQLDPYLVQTAFMDPNFKTQYETAIKLDSQQRIIDAFKKDQTKIEQIPKNIRDMANLDPEFDKVIHQYYNVMENTSSSMKISIPQLIELQGLTGEKQTSKYEQFQFDNMKQNQQTVLEAKEISSEEDQVRQADFYDIDQAYLETDPTAISHWHPTDSQILQAHAAGMNLNEYVNYMHQLSLGKAGDFTKLPKYTDEQLRASGLLDYSHFQDELQIAGYRKDLYLYDPKTRQFTLNPNVTNSAPPSTQESFISRYTPKYLIEARNKYADMVHGLNQENQHEVDNYNTNLMKELSSYGKHYDSIVASINNERLYQGRSDLLFYDVGSIYNQNRLEFNPINVSEKTKAEQSLDTTLQQMSYEQRLIQQEKQEALERYDVTAQQYSQVKTDLVNMGIRDPTQERVQARVDVVKQEAVKTQAVAQPTTS